MGRWALCWTDGDEGQKKTEMHRLRPWWGWRWWWWRLQCYRRMRRTEGDCDGDIEPKSFWGRKHSLQAYIDAIFTWNKTVVSTPDIMAPKELMGYKSLSVGDNGASLFPVPWAHQRLFFIWLLLSCRSCFFRAFPDPCICWICLPSLLSPSLVCFLPPYSYDLLLFLLIVS